MKNLSFFITAFVCGLAFLAGNPVSAREAAASSFFNWGLLWSVSWEENKNIHNLGEIRLHFLPLGLLLRSQILDRQTLHLELDTFQWDESWSNPEKGVTNFTGGLYHRQTGSRLLFGVLDEWGLSARIRNPWIRSPPYAENHKPLMADIKTAASSTKEDEVYLYLSSPFLELSQNIKLRSFVSAQTQIENFTPAFSAGLDLVFANSANAKKADANSLLLEVFYTGKTLPPTNNSTWFSASPPLPERDFNLYAAGLLFASPSFAVSADFAMSETFAWGTDIYSNLGITVTPLLPFGTRVRPLSISLAADGAGERFVNRDGGNLSEGFRGAAKIEWKSRYNSLLSLSSVIRANGFGEEFNRSSSGFFWRLPAIPASRDNSNFPIRLTRISLSADRNAVNPLNINDSFSGTIGLNVNLRQIRINNPIRISLSGSIKGSASPEGTLFFYPIPDESWQWNTISANCELFWSINSTGSQRQAYNYQFRSKIGVSFLAEEEKKWDFSLSAAVRFKHGRLSLKVASPDFPERWNWTISWRVEKKENP